MENIISKLRHGENLTFFDKKNKHFHHFQLNSTTKFICWQRHVSLDRQNWIKWNECLSLKDILSCINDIKSNVHKTQSIVII